MDHYVSKSYLSYEDEDGGYLKPIEPDAEKDMDTVKEDKIVTSIKPENGTEAPPPSRRETRSAFPVLTLHQILDVLKIDSIGDLRFPPHDVPIQGLDQNSDLKSMMNAMERVKTVETVTTHAIFGDQKHAIVSKAKFPSNEFSEKIISSEIYQQPLKGIDLQTLALSDISTIIDILTIDQLGTFHFD